MRMFEIYLMAVSVLVPYAAYSEEVSAYALIGNESHWHGKQITVSGFFFADRASLLYINAESLRYLERSDSFLLDADREFIQAFKHLNGQRLTFAGKFSADNYLGASGTIVVDEAETEKILKMIYGYSKKPVEKKVSSQPTESPNK